MEPLRPNRGDELSSADLRQTVGEFLRVLILRRWVFFVPFCLAAAAAFIASQYIPRTYEARARFEQRTDPVSVNLPPQIMTGTFGYFLNTLEQDIKGSEVMGPVVDELGLTDALPKDADGQLTEAGLKQREAIGRRLAANVEVAAWSQTKFHNFIDLRYTGSDSATMIKVLNLMKEEYIKLIRQRVTEKLVDTRDWYAKQAEEQRRTIDEIDGKMTAKRLEHPGVDPANPGSIALQVDSAERVLASLKRDHSRLSSRISSRRRFLAAAKGQGGADLPAMIAPNPQTQRIQGAIAASEERITDLKSARGMTELHPDIVAERKLQNRLHTQLASVPARPAPSAVSDTVTAIKDFVSGPIAGIWSPEVASAESDLGSWLEQLGEVKEDITAAEERLATLSLIQSKVFATRTEFTHIQDDLERARADYETFQSLVGQCNRGLTVENQERGIRFADILPPGGSTVPVSPQTKTVLILSILAGIACGAICVVMAELFDHRFRTSTQVSKSLGIPLLERIDEIVTPSLRRQQLVRRAIVVPAVSVTLVLIVGLSGVLAYLSLNSPDTYRRLMHMPRSAWASIAGDSNTQTADGPTAQIQRGDRWDG